MKKRLRVRKTRWLGISTTETKGWRIERCWDRWEVWLDFRQFATCSEKWMAEAIVRAAKRGGAK